VIWVKGDKTLIDGIEDDIKFQSFAEFAFLSFLLASQIAAPYNPEH